MNKQVKDKEKEEKRLNWTDLTICQAGLGLKPDPNPCGPSCAPGWAKTESSPDPGWAKTEFPLPRVGRVSLTRLGRILRLGRPGFCFTRLGRVPLH